MKSVLAILCLLFALRAQGDINIPERDLASFRYVFQGLLDREDFTYPLFGSKPMALTWFVLRVPKTLPLYRWPAVRCRLFRNKAGLKIWEKYADELQSKDFILIYEKEVGCELLVLINKKELLQTLYANQEIFQLELGAPFIPEVFLEKLEKKEISISEVIYRRHHLLGIMLGYGRKNSLFFQERYKLRKKARQRKTENLPEDPLLTVALEEIESHAGDFNPLAPRDPIVEPLYFLALPDDPETIALQKQYEEDRLKIVELRKKKNFMDLVMKRLFL